MRFINDLAARRFLYRRPIVTMPDVLVIDIPMQNAAPSLSLGRYYPVILETADELGEIDTFLTAERLFPIVPDLFDRRPSALDASDITFCRYMSPALDWPMLLLCHWPSEFTAMVPPGSDYFARGCYTTEMFDSFAELESAEQKLIDTLGSRHPLTIRPVGATYPPGHA